MEQAVIKIKRGRKENLPNLTEGELALTTDEKSLYIGSTSGNIKFTSENDMRILSSNVIESAERQFLTSIEKARILSMSEESTSFSERIHALEAKEPLSKNMVKLNSETPEAFLQDHLDGTTIQSHNNKVVAKTLDNLLATINELNFLQGATENIQQQINNLSGVSLFRGVFSSIDLLNEAEDPQPGQYAVLSEDGSSSYFFYYENEWGYSHKTNTNSLIDINQSTIGLLSKERYVLPKASDILFVDSSGTMTSMNTQDAILELFQNTNNFIERVALIIGHPANKSDKAAQLIQKIENQIDALVASINYKGIPAHKTDGLQSLASKVLKIPNVTVEGTVKKIAKINMIAPYELKIPLNEPLQLSDITTTLIEFVQGATGIVHYDIGFDNGDASDFEPNDLVLFDGKMKLKTEYTLDMIKDETWTGEGSVHEIQIKVDDWLSIDRLNIIGGEI